MSKLPSSKTGAITGGEMASPEPKLSGAVAYEALPQDQILEGPQMEEGLKVIHLTNGYQQLSLNDIIPKQYDAVIMNADNDDDIVKAEVLKQRLEVIDLSDGDRPKVELYDNMYEEVQQKVERLDKVLSDTTLFLALVTEDLVRNEDMWEERGAVYGTLMKFLANNPNCFIPVYKENPNGKDWVPSLIRNNRGLIYSEFDQQLPAIKKTFDFHLQTRKEREQRLKEEVIANGAQRR